jgi:hypothetical protein
MLLIRLGEEECCYPAVVERGDDCSDVRDGQQELHVVNAADDQYEKLTT